MLFLNKTEWFIQINNTKGKPEMMACPFLYNFEREKLKGEYLNGWKKH